MRTTLRQIIVALIVLFSAITICAYFGILDKPIFSCGVSHESQWVETNCEICGKPIDRNDEVMQAILHYKYETGTGKSTAKIFGLMKDCALNLPEEMCSEMKVK